MFGWVVGWAAGLAGGCRAWPLHPAVFLARTPGPGALRRLEGMRAGPFLWNKTLSTSPGPEHLLSPGLRGAGEVAPFQVRKPSLGEGGYWVCRCLLSARPLLSILVCPPAMGVVVHPPCSERPTFTEAPHFPRSQGLQAVVAQAGDCLCTTPRWPGAASPPRWLEMVPVGNLEGLSRPGVGGSHSQAQDSSQ